MLCQNPYDPENFELSPRFVKKLVEGGTGIGLLQRAQKEVTQRAFLRWLETGRPHEGANWEDAERSLVHWRSFGVEDDDSPKAQKRETVALEDLDFDFTHLSRRDLIDLCAAMQKNLRTAKSACSEQKSAAKALRKELQHERARVQRFSCKLMATESELALQRKSESNEERLPSELSLDRPSERIEHFSKVTPRARPRRRIPSHTPRRRSDGAAGNNHSTGDARWLSDTQSDGQNVLSSEFHDVQVGKFDDDSSLDETICPDGDSNMNLPKSYGPLYDCYDPKERGDNNLDTDHSSSEEDFEFSLPKAWR